MAVDHAAVNHAFRVVYARPATTQEAAEYAAYPSVQAVLDALYATPAYREQTLPIGQLYVGILGRDPEPAGLRYYIHRMREEGLTFAQVTSCVLQSPEAQATWADAAASDLSFVQALYRSFLGREGEHAGIEYYLGGLREGVRDRLSIAVSFALSPERQAQVADKRFAAYEPPPPVSPVPGRTKPEEPADDGPTFRAAEDAGHIVRFSGTATGPITVSLAGPGATFTRAGIASAVVALATVTGFQDDAPLQLTAAQFDALKLRLEAADQVSIRDSAAGIAAALAALVAHAASVDAIDAADAAAIVLTKAQWADLGSAKLAADDTITVQDDSLEAEIIAVLGADDKIDAIRAATMTLDRQQYADARAKLAAADVITILDNALNAEEIVALAADDKVDAVRAGTITLTRKQYEAASAKLDERDHITIHASALTADDIATLGADDKVDAIRAGTPMTLSVGQFAAAAAKLDAADTLYIADTGAAITAAKAMLITYIETIDAIDATDATTITLSQRELADLGSDRLAADDQVTVRDDFRWQSELAALVADGKVDKIRSGSTMYWSIENFTAGHAKLDPADYVMIDDSGADIDATDATTITLSQRELADLGSDRLAADDQVTVRDDFRWQSELAALVADGKVDKIRSGSTMYWNVENFTAGSAKLEPADYVMIADSGAAIDAALAVLVERISLVDGINAWNGGTISMSVDQLVAITPGKIWDDDHVRVVDTSARIDSAWALLLPGIKVDVIDSSDNLVAINLTAAQAVQAGSRLTAADRVFVAGDSATLHQQTLSNVDRLTVTGGATFGAGSNASGELGGGAGVDAPGEWSFEMVAGKSVLTLFDGSARSITLTGVTTVLSDGSAVFSFS